MDENATAQEGEVVETTPVVETVVPETTESVETAGSEPGVDVEYPYPTGSLDADPQW